MGNKIDWDNLFSFNNISLDMIHLFKDNDTKSNKPEGQIEKIKTLYKYLDPSSVGCPFEKAVDIIEIIKINSNNFIRVTLYCCYAGPNGSPCGGWSEYYFLIKDNNIDNITIENWRNYVASKIDYCFDRAEDGSFVREFKEEHNI